MLVRGLLVAALGMALLPSHAGASVAAAAGADYTLVLKDDGTVWTWGNNTYGQLGDDSTNPHTQPVQVSSLTGVTAIAAGSAHSMALKADGTVWVWGNNFWSQLGLDGTYYTPTPTQLPTLSGIVAIAGGTMHSLALASDGTVWSWGGNSYGQLGDGTNNPHSTPAQVPGLTNVVAIAAGGYHSLVVKSDGTVWSWGANWNGQLGDGTTTGQVSPVAITSLSDIVRVAGGDAHSLALKSDGSLYAWGNNDAGQLGDGSVTQRVTPIAVSSVPATATIVARSYWSGIIDTSNQIWTWGDNGSGQVGDGTTVPLRPTPSQRPELANAAAVAAGNTHGVAITTDGTVYTWSANWNGQLGDGTNASSLSPIAISGPGFEWAVGAPTFYPGDGSSYYNEFGVSIGSATPDAVIHYTTDGSLPTESSPTFSDVVTIDQSETIRARAFKAGVPTSHVSSASYSLYLFAPTFSPHGGTFNTPRPITITAADGATVRYTTDNTDPTESSPVYSGPVTLSAPTILKAKAFRSGWTASATTTAVYTIYNDAVPPTIIASLTPSPNAAGWNNNYVTVSFACSDAGSGIRTCPSPVTVYTPGVQTVSGTAIDNAGNTALGSATVRIDYQGPDIAVQTPAANTIVHASAVTISGTVTDAQSGVGGVTCDGVPAQMDGTSFSCGATVSPGVTYVNIQATDLAGNVNNTSRAILMESPYRITPDKPKLGLGSSRELRLVDAQGQTVSAATWTVSDSSIVSLSTSNGIVITGDSAGTATVTAAINGGTTQTTVTVFPTASLPAGTVRWSAPATPSNSGTSSLLTHAQNDSGTGPDLFWVENGSTGLYLRALRSDGTQLWRRQITGAPNSLRDNVLYMIGDTAGGVLITMSSYLDLGTDDELVQPNLVLRFDDSGAETWRYTDTGYFGQPALHPDGIMVFTHMWETASFGANTHLGLMGLNTLSGSLAFQVELPQTTDAPPMQGPVCGERSVSYGAPMVGNITVGPDGHFYVLTTTWTHIDTGDCLTYAHSKMDQILELKDLQTDGSISGTTLYESHYDGDFTYSFSYPLPGSVLPSPTAGEIATWSVYNNAAGTDDHWVSLVNGGTHTDAQVAGARGLAVIGEGNVAYGSMGQEIFAVDTQTLGQVWRTTTADQAHVLAALTDGHVLVHTDAGQLLNFDSAGTASIISDSFPGVAPTPDGDLVSFDTDGALTDSALDEALETAASPFPLLDGNASLQRGGPTPRLTVTSGTVTRGKTATFKLTGAVTAANVTGWKFESDAGNSIRNDGIVATTWGGTMVTSGKVTATVNSGPGTPTKSYSRPITVSDRTSGFRFDAVTPQKVHSGDVTLSNGTALTLHDTPTHDDMQVGVSALNPLWHYTYNSVSNGPNTGFWYMLSIENSLNGAQTAYYYIVAADVENTASDFYRAQCGNYNPATHTGFVSGPQLFADTVQHEAGTDGESHYMYYRTSQDDDANNIGVQAEKFVLGPTVTTQSQFTQQANQALGAANTRIQTATAVEPCGGIVRGPHCEDHGGLNVAPYQACQ